MTRLVTLLSTVLVMAVIVAAALFTGRFTSATGPDVNNDGYVTGLDFFAVLKAFGSSVPTPPTVVGNRALVTVNNFGGVILYDTTDGSLVAVVTGGPTGYGPNLTSAVVGNSCDGAFGAAAEKQGSGQRVRIIRTTDGVIVVSHDELSAPFNMDSFGPFAPARVLYPCPLKATGGTFDSGSPAANRAVVASLSDAGSRRVTVYDLLTGQPLFTDLTTGGAWLNCANDTLIYSNTSNEAANLVRLSDGAPLGSMPGYPNVAPTC